MIIYKYPLQWEDSQTLQIPDLQRPLAVQLQHNVPVLWAFVDENGKPAPHRIRIYGTGNRMPPEPGEYIGTIQVGGFVFHFFRDEVNS